jgi:hypothetical protein
MSTPESEPLTFDDSDDPVIVDPPADSDPEPDPDPTPPPPVGDTIVWEPATWYSITYACRTVGCPNENVVHGAPMFYSNDGQNKNIRVIDSVCNKDSMIVTATKLDPQPVEE